MKGAHANLSASIARAQAHLGASLAQARQYVHSQGLVGTPRLRQPGSVVLNAWVARHQPAASPSVRATAHAFNRPRRAQGRSFTAGGNGPMLGGMESTDWHINQSLYLNLRAMRARANWLARNNDYARAFLRMVRSNVVGPNGVTFQAHVTNARGALVTADAQKLEAGWCAWGRRDVCDVLGEHSWLEFQEMWITAIARDGEVLVRRYPGRGAQGLQLQLLPAHLLDEQHHRDLPNGHRVRMGIEFDAQWRRVAYWLLEDVGRSPFAVGLQSRKYTRVPASEIWHDFVSEWPGQWRGMPWMVTTIATQQRLGEYEDAALMAAEEGAKKLAWLRTPDGTVEALANRQDIEQPASDGDTAQAAIEDPEDDADGAPVAGTLYTDTGKGVHYASLPRGVEPIAFDSKYPDASAADFIKHFVRRMSSGLGVPYHSLANNLEGVNFSSTRAGELEARETWKRLQTFMIDRLCARVYAEWLPLAMLSGAVVLPYDRLSRYLEAAGWQGRRWQWVDPLKDVQCAVSEIGAGITSVSRVIREKGNDPDEVLAEIRRERELYADVFSLLKAAAPNQPAAPAAGATDPAAADPSVLDPEDPEAEPAPDAEDPEDPNND